MYETAPTNAEDKKAGQKGTVILSPCQWALGYKSPHHLTPTPLDCGVVLFLVKYTRMGVVKN